MQVKLNAFRGEDRPGDIVEVSDADGAALIHHGAAFPVDDIDVELDKAEAAGRRTVRASAALQASSGTETDQAPAP